MKRRQLNMNYKMNFATNTLTITKDFEKKAMIPNSEESTLLLHLQSLRPNLKIAYKMNRTNNRNTKGLTYTKMEKYIRLHENANDLLIAFSTIKEVGRTQNNAYNFVYNWFMTQFPDYGEMPEIKNGKLIAEMIDYESFIESNDNLEAA